MDQATTATLFERDDRGLASRCVAARGSSTLAVVFSQLRVPAGHFGLSRLFAHTTHGLLFLNQPENHWYRGAEAAIDRAICDAIAHVKPRRILFYGSSMGAYGALVTAARWPEAEALVFVPDFVIGETGSRSAEAGIAPVAGEPGLADHLALPRNGAIEIVFGLYDAYDGGVAARLRQRLKGDRPVRLTPLLSSHEVHDHLYRLNIIRRVISQFRRDPGVEAASKGLRPDTVDWELLARLGHLAGKPAMERGDFSGLPVETHPGAALLKVESLITQGAFGDAEALLATVDHHIETDPILSGLPARYRKQFPIRRVDLLERLGRLDAAEAIRAEVAQRFSARL